MIYFKGMADKQLASTESVGGVSGQELGWSLWWVDHREQIRKIGIALFVALDAILIGIGLWGFTDWLAFGGLNEEQAVRQMTSSAYGQFAALSLEEVQIGAPIVLPGTTGKIDILVPVENRNARYWTELHYRLVVGGTELPLRTAFVLPGQSRYLAELSASTEHGSSVELKVERRLWHRAITAGDLDQQAFAETRLNIQGENAVYKQADPQATSPSSSASFTLVNHTAFNFYDVGVLVLLYRGDAIVGVNRIQADQLQSGDRKPMEIFWYQALPQVTKVVVAPELNIYDPSVYRKPGV